MTEGLRRLGSWILPELWHPVHPGLEIDEVWFWMEVFQEGSIISEENEVDGFW